MRYSETHENMSRSHFTPKSTCRNTKLKEKACFKPIFPFSYIVNTFYPQMYVYINAKLLFKSKILITVFLITIIFSGILVIIIIHCFFISYKLKQCTTTVLIL